MADLENPVVVAAELWHFLGHQGAFIAFSWPATTQRRAHVSDIENAAASARALRERTAFVSERSRAGRIRIVGYGAGTRLVSPALAGLGVPADDLTGAESLERVRLGRAILAGSDLDPAVLGGYMTRSPCDDSQKR